MKKVKLFTTIASLCLAVALMAFGVYAAANETFTVKGTVSFVASTDVIGEFTAIQSVINAETAGDTITAKNTVDAPTWVFSTGDDNVMTPATGATFEPVSVSAKDDTYTYTFSFKNLTPEAVNVTITDTTANAANDKTPDQEAVWTVSEGTTTIEGQPATAETAGHYVVEYNETITYTFTVKINTINFANNSQVDINVALNVVRP